LHTGGCLLSGRARTPGLLNPGHPHRHGTVSVVLSPPCILPATEKQQSRCGLALDINDIEDVRQQSELELVVHPSIRSQRGRRVHLGGDGGGRRHHRQGVITPQLGSTKDLLRDVLPTGVRVSPRKPSWPMSSLLQLSAELAIRSISNTHSPHREVRCHDRRECEICYEYQPPSSSIRYIGAARPRGARA